MGDFGCGDGGWAPIMKINGNKVKINPRINSLLIQKVERSGKEDGQNLRVFPERRQESLACLHREGAWNRLSLISY